MVACHSLPPCCLCLFPSLSLPLPSPPSLQGHWTRIAEQVAGGLTYKPPVSDINAPDLFIPVTAFASYVVIGSFCLGLLGRWVGQRAGREDGIDSEQFTEDSSGVRC